MTTPAENRQRAGRVDFATMADIVTPWAIRVAATLRLADYVAAGCTEVEQLAEAAGADPDALGRLLRYLACRGIFREIRPGAYALTPAARLLQDRNGVGLRSALDLEGFYGRQDRLFARLLDVVRTGEPVHESTYGRSFWDDLEAQPELTSQFQRMMVDQVAPVAGAVAQAYEWRDVHHVVDVGGGSGILLTAVLRAAPHLRGTLVDLGGPARLAGDTFAAAGVSDRCDVVTQSFFDPLPAGGDVYLLSEVIHDWNDASAAQILRRCAEAAGPGGRVLLVEALASTSDVDAVDSTALDLRMLVSMGGCERTVDEMARLAESAGLRLSRRFQVPGRTILECRREPSGAEQVEPVQQ